MAAGGTAACPVYGALVLPKPGIEYVYSVTFGPSGKNRSRAGHTRRCHAVEEIDSTAYDLEDVVNVANAQEMPRLGCWQKRDDPLQDLIHVCLGPAEGATNGKAVKILICNE